MPGAGYLIHARKGGINDLNIVLVRAAGSHLGGAIHPTSSEHGFVSADTYKQLRTEFGAKKLASLMNAHGVTVVRALDEFEAIALMRTRDLADVGPRCDRVAPPMKDRTSGLKLDWHLVECGFPMAWDVFGGPHAIDWTGIRVGHIDTGFTRHPALGFASDDGDSDWIDTARDGNFFSTELDTSIGTPVFVDSESAEERDLGGTNAGHGTRTLSVLCGFDEGATARRGDFAAYLGGAPRVPVVPVRLQDSVWLQGRTLSEDLPDAMEHLVERAGVDIITLSMGGPVGNLLNDNAPPKLRRIIDRAYERGVIVCCAAGNRVSRVVFPARSPRTIAVAGIADDRRIWSGSTRGAQVDVCAPAHAVRRADVRRTAGAPAFAYAPGSGTSYATPLVAAAAALWLARWGAEIDSDYSEGWQRVEAFKSLLTATAVPGEDWNAAVHGAGILHAGALLAAPLPEAAVLRRDTGQDWS